MAHHYVDFLAHYFQLLVWNYNLAVARLLNALRYSRPLKPTIRKEIAYFPMADENDPRPEVSPFESANMEVYFREGPALHVPGSLIFSCPNLGLGSRGKWPPRSIILDDVTSAVGHIIFYYLLTDTYQSLRPKGASRQDRLVSELTTSVGVYNASRKYDIPALQEISTGEIQRLAHELPFPLVLNLLRSLHLNASARETWLDDYVQTGLQSIFRTPTAFLDETVLQVDDDVISFSNIILKGLANLLSTNTTPVGSDIAAPPTPQPQLDVIDEEPVHALEPRSEAAPLAEPEESTPFVEERAPSPVPAPPEPEPEPELEPVIVTAEFEDRTPGDRLSFSDWEHFGKKLDAAPDVEPEPVEVAAEDVPHIPEDPMAYLVSQEEPPTLDEAPVHITYMEQKPVPIDELPAATPEPAPEAAPAPVPVPVPEPVLVPEAIITLTSGKKKKKKRLSFFRSEEAADDIATPPKVESQEQLLTPAATPDAVSEARAADEALLSPASSSGATPTKKKKKKKTSIFRAEEDDKTPGSLWAG
ncbi:hypothetical protein F4777DRAFT_504219 [Nemania sp. FL0916]|nr:hypothetical protein F4777DRAFT_504219 [Nemania sp. FL0916]